MGASVFFSGSDETVTVTITYTVAGVLTDPTTVSWAVTSPTGTTTTYTYAGATITRDSVGQFSKEITCADPGDWVLVSDSAGAAADANEVRWTVFQSNAHLLCSVESLKSRFGIGDTADDFELQGAVRAASRRIESYCGRERFWRDPAVTTRTFQADNSRSCRVPVGISTATGLIVKIDEAGDGTFGTTLTVNTDFILRPTDALSKSPAWPHTEVWLADNYSFPVLCNGRDGVQITARFGWPAVPDDVREAALILSHRLFKRKETSTGVVGFDALGATVRLARTDPDVAELLSPYVVYGVA